MYVHEHARIVLPCVESVCIKMAKQALRSYEGEPKIGHLQNQTPSNVSGFRVKIQSDTRTYVCTCQLSVSVTVSWPQRLKQSLHTKARPSSFNCRRYFTRASTIRDLFPRYGEEQRRLTSLGTSIKLRLANNREIRVARCKRGEATPSGTSFLRRIKSKLESTFQCCFALRKCVPPAN